MTAAITGGIGLASGLFGMIGGLRGASKANAIADIGPGPAPAMYQLAGQEQEAAYKAQASDLSRQSVLAYEQSQVEAAQTERQMTAFKEQQALKFASSGITLQGSPLGVLEETRTLGQQEADAIRRRGSEQSSLYESQGLQMLRQGSAANFSGFANALNSTFQSKVQSYQMKVQASQVKNQAYQTGLSGLRAGIQGLGDAFGSPAGGFASWFKSSQTPPAMVP